MRRDIRTPSLVTVQPVLRDPREQPVLPERLGPPPPAHLFGGGSSAVMALNDRRRELASILTKWWNEGDVRGFSLFAPEAMWFDPDLALLLPPDAAQHALTLVNEAAIRAERQRLR